MTRNAAVRLANHLRSKGLRVRVAKSRLWNRDGRQFREIFSVRLDDQVHEINPTVPVMLKTRAAADVHHGVELHDAPLRSYPKQRRQS